LGKADQSDRHENRLIQNGKASMSTQLNVPESGALPPAAYTDHPIEAGGVRLHVQDYGTAGKPPILCVHGGAAHAHWFDFIASGLNADYHVRAIDQRGHGDSAWADAAAPDYSYERYAADLDEAVDKLGLRDFALVGHSMGGVVSTVYAATYPGRVARLVVIDSTITMPPERIASMHAVGNREGRSYADHAEFMANYKLRPAGSSATPQVIRHLAHYSGRQFEDGRWRYKFDRNVYARRERMDSLPYWAKIKIPALIIKGSRSERISPQVVADVTARAPQVTVSEVADSDHHVTLDNPAGFVRALKAFLETSR
jgi:pimeloyl-ACP methyl ester carboxylesterase